MRQTAGKYAKSWMVAHNAAFAGERLIRSGELHVGLQDFDDDVPIGDSFRLELDVNLEIWTVLTDKCFSS